MCARSGGGRVCIKTLVQQTPVRCTHSDNFLATVVPSHACRLVSMYIQMFVKCSFSQKMFMELAPLIKMSEVHIILHEMNRNDK